MSDLDKEICSFCGHSLDSDIVFCPICGTPMHRECWDLEKKCPNEALHAEGFVWQSEIKDEPEATDEPQVKPLYNDEDIPRGTPFGEYFANMPKGDENPDEEKYMGVSERELAHFCNLAQPQGIFRLSALKNMAQSGKKISFSIFSGLLKPYYQFYRGMQAEGFIILFLQTLFSLPQLFLYMCAMMKPALAETLATNSAFYSVASIANYLGMAFTIAMCLFGDYLYLRFATHKIKQLREVCREKPQEEYLGILAQAGTPRMVRVLEGLIFQLIITIALMLIISSNF